MPWGWIIFKTPTGTEDNPSLSPNPGLPTDPVKLETFVRDVVTNAGAEFIYLYFEVGAPHCHVVVKNLDKYENAKAVTDILHAISYTKLLGPRQAKRARGLEPRYRKPRPGGKPSGTKRPPKKP